MRRLIKLTILGLTLLKISCSDGTEIANSDEENSLTSESSEQNTLSSNIFHAEIDEEITIKDNTLYNFTSSIDEDGNTAFTIADQGAPSYKCTAKGTCPTWEEINCKEHTVGAFTVKHLCKNPVTGEAYAGLDMSEYKFFIQGYENFTDYMKAIQDQTMDEGDHLALFQLLLETRDNLRELLEEEGRPSDLQLVNHNLDVNTLHFKFECGNSNKKCLAID